MNRNVEADFTYIHHVQRGAEDTTVTLLDSCCRLLDEPRTCIRILMMDFSSTFNTIQCHVLLKRLIDLEISPSPVLWIRSFLSYCPHRVIVNNVLSHKIVVNTGAPQGCVLSSTRFSIYTNETTCDDEVLKLMKFADDMALVEKITDENSLSKYYDFIRNIISWFQKSFLTLNVTKTKELCIEGQRAKDHFLLRPVQIGSENVDQVENFKYLGIVIDKNITFTSHVDAIIKKKNQRLYLLRKLRSFNVIAM